MRATDLKSLRSTGPGDVQLDIDGGQDLPEPADLLALRGVVGTFSGSRA